MRVLPRSLNGKVELEQLAAKVDLPDLSQSSHQNGKGAASGNPLDYSPGREGSLTEKRCATIAK